MSRNRFVSAFFGLSTITILSSVALGQHFGPTVVSVDFVMGDPEGAEDANIRKYGATLGKPKADIEAEISADIAAACDERTYRRVLPWKFVTGKSKFPRLEILLYCAKPNWKVKLSYRVGPEERRQKPPPDLTNPENSAVVDDVFFPGAEIIRPKRSDFRAELSRRFKTEFRNPLEGKKLRARLQMAIPVGEGKTLVNQQVTAAVEAIGDLLISPSEQPDLGLATFKTHASHKTSKRAHTLDSRGIDPPFEPRDPAFKLMGIPVQHEFLDDRPIGERELKTIRDLEDHAYFYLVKFPDLTEDPIGELSAAPLTAFKPRATQ